MHWGSGGEAGLPAASQGAAPVRIRTKTPGLFHSSLEQFSDVNDHQNRLEGPVKQQLLIPPPQFLLPLV